MCLCYKYFSLFSCEAIPTAKTFRSELLRPNSVPVYIFMKIVQKTKEKVRVTWVSGYIIKEAISSAINCLFFHEVTVYQQLLFAKYSIRYTWSSRVLAHIFSTFLCTEIPHV